MFELSQTLSRRVARRSRGPIHDQLRLENEAARPDKRVRLRCGLASANQGLCPHCPVDLVHVRPTIISRCIINCLHLNFELVYVTCIE